MIHVNGCIGAMNIIPEQNRHLITLLHGLGWLACAFAVLAHAQDAIPVETDRVRIASLADSITAVGSLAASESVMIRPEITGRVRDIRFSEGESVKAGALLITLDDAEWRARLEESQALLKLAQLSHERLREMAAKQLTSRQDADKAALELDGARARLSADRQRLDKTVLRAPFAGVTGLRRVSPGDYVQAGQDLVNLEAIDELKMDFSVPERHLSALKSGLPLSLQTEAWPGESFSGAVYAIDPRVDDKTRSIALRARVANSQRRLRPGMFVAVKLKIAERPQALIAPEQALWPVGGQTFVYRVTGGKADMVAVTTGARRPGEVEIVSGLAAGDTVIVAGQQKLKPGAPVVPVAPAPVGAR